MVTLLGVVVGGSLGRWYQDRHWVKDTRAAAYRGLLREYTRTEFDVRRAYLGLVPVTDIDWPRWGAATAELSLVADEPVILATQGISDVLVRMDGYVHGGERDDERWRSMQYELAQAQMRFVNTARRSLSRGQPSLVHRLGGPLIIEPER